FASRAQVRAPQHARSAKNRCFVWRNAPTRLKLAPENPPTSRGRKPMTMQAFLEQLQNLFLIYWQPVAKAVLILVVAHFVAKAVKWAIAKGVDRIPFFARRETLAVGVARPHSRLGERVGEVGYWII